MRNYYDKKSTKNLQIKLQKVKSDLGKDARILSTVFFSTLETLVFKGEFRDSISGMSENFPTNVAVVVHRQ